MSPSRFARVALATLGTSAIAIGLGTFLGWLSWHIWILGLLGLSAGLGLGFAASFFRAWLGLSARLGAAIGVASLPLAFGTFLVMEDGNHLRAWQEEVAEARVAELGLPPEAADAVERAGGVSFLAADATAMLDADLRARLGADGFYGRLLQRLDRGVRIGGGFRTVRGLEVGRLGALIAWASEFLLALVFVLRVVRKANPPAPE